MPSAVFVHGSPESRAAAFPTPSVWVRCTHGLTMHARPAPLPARTLLGPPFLWVTCPTPRTQQKDFSLLKNLPGAHLPSGLRCRGACGLLLLLRLPRPLLDWVQGLQVRSFMWLMSFSHIVSFVISSWLPPKASLRTLSQEWSADCWAILHHRPDLVLCPSTCVGYHAHFLQASVGLVTQLTLAGRLEIPFALVDPSVTGVC